MSLTRHWLKPWRAKTRTAASRMTRRFSAASFSLRADNRVLRPAVGLGAAIGQRRQPRADRGLGLEVEVSGDHGLGIGGLGQDEPPRVDDHRAPSRPQALGVLAHLVGGDDEALVL